MCTQSKRLYSGLMTRTAKLRSQFPHSKLDVYHVASSLFVACWSFAERIEHRNAFLRSQFLRAALSIKLNITEGAAETSGAENARFYRMARRSAAECAAILDDFPMTLKISDEDLHPFYVELTRISRMLNELIKSVEKRTPKRAR